MDSKTRALHIRVDNNNTGPAITPVYKSNAFSADSPYFYTRRNNPNIEEFEQVVACLEKANHAVAVSCGMAAIYLCLDLLEPGQKLLINKDIYGCSYKLFQRISRRRGFKLDVLDLSDEDNVCADPA